MAVAVEHHHHQIRVLSEQVAEHPFSMLALLMRCLLRVVAVVAVETTTA
jgi:hypothetical protein